MTFCPPECFITSRYFLKLSHASFIFTFKNVSNVLAFENLTRDDAPDVNAYSVTLPIQVIFISFPCSDLKKECEIVIPNPSGFFYLNLSRNKAASSSIISMDKCNNDFFNSKEM